MFHFNATKKEILENLIDESSKERLNKLFTEAIVGIGSKIDLFLDRIVETTFAEINSELFCQMFRWA